MACLSLLLVRWCPFKFVNSFVYEIGREESDFNKRAKIDALKLSDEEWTNVESFIDLLKVGSTTQCFHVT